MLLAVYRFLYELGCRWIRPSRDGEIISSLKLERSKMNVSVNETASYRHRGICIEGQVNYEHVRDMLDWLPKLGMRKEIR